MPEPSHNERLNDDKPDLLDAGMEVAFGAISNGPQGAGSVLEALCASAKEIPSILLRDVLSEQPGIVDAHSPKLLAGGTRLGRFQISGEIARGGMGVILRGRDSDLGRDVAIKVLRSKHGNNPDMIRRFVEEAQIGGQLEHPSILPIHELGIGADRRPFFTMRMIQGDTLAKALQERKDPRRDLRRFITIFQQVCQAVAYAHARGVVHRDLKPSNIMLGPFGEVQVMDWGLAKVLTRGGTTDDARPGPSKDRKVTTIRSVLSAASSSSGSVIGTPQYMAPEQARGEIDELDERADVFSLGAILCEILTGEPPYVGQDGDSVRRKAATARLDRAKARLRTCGADSQLVKIAWWCMRPITEDRPRDSGVLAKKVAGYLAELDERARVAELEAAEAQVKAEQEHRARKLTLGLATSVLLTVLLGGGAWWAVLDSRRVEREQNDAQVAAVLDDASRLYGIAASDSFKSLIPWQTALGRIEDASDMAGEDTSVALGRRLHRLRVEIERGLEDARMIARLDSIDLRSSSLDAQDPYLRLSRREAYQEAFSEYGIPVVELTEVEAVQEIRTRAIAVELATALDRWSMLDRHNAEGSIWWRTLLRISMASDPDPWRNKLRSLLLNGVDDDSLRELADEIPSTLPVISLRILADELKDRGMLRDAVAILKPAWLRNPADKAIAYSISSAHIRFPPDLDAALVEAGAAIALDPGNDYGWYLLGRVYFARKELAKAREAIDEAIRLEPGHSHSHFLLGDIFTALGQSNEALRSFETAHRLDPHLHPLPDSEASESPPGTVENTVLQARTYSNLGTASINAGRDLEAHESLSKARELDPRTWNHANNLGVAAAGLGRFEEAVDHFTKALKLAGESPSPVIYKNLGCSLYLLDDLDGAMHALEKSLEGWATFDLNRPNRDWWLGVWSGAHSYRAGVFRLKGNLDSALASVEAAIATQPREEAGYKTLILVLLGVPGRDFNASLERAVPSHPDLDDLYNILGLELMEEGLFEDAVAAFSRAIELNPNNLRTISNRQRARRMVAYQFAIIEDRRQSDDATEIARAARVAQDRGLSLSAARLWKTAFEIDPDLDPDMNKEWRRSGAAAMVRASFDDEQSAEELSPQERTQLREEALAWLRMELAWRRAKIAGAYPQRSLLALRRLLEDPSFATTRRPEEADGLPQEEAAGWRSFWDEARAISDKFE